MHTIALECKYTTAFIGSRRSNFVYLVSCHLIPLILIVSVLLLTIVSFSRSSTSAISTNNNSTLTSILTASDRLESELFNHVKNSVVEINVGGSIPNPHIIIGGKYMQQPFSAFGSGFIYDTDGHVVTNYHVISGANVISVRFLDGNSYSASILGEDVYSDLAVLQIDPSVFYGEQPIPPPIPLANSSTVQVGERVVAIGNPLGLSGSMTQGIISQTNRATKDLTGRFWMSDLIQTDAAIDPGNSGGPLLDLNGKVLGVTEQEGLSTWGSNSIPASGIGLAISSNTIQRVIPKLITHGIYKHAWLGIHIADVTPLIAETIGLKEAKGVLILDTLPGSPLNAEGIKFTSDNPNIILGVDQNIVREKSDLISYINDKSPGDNVDLKVLESDGAIHDINIKLAERP
jgi:S1-C subfamily serine protease